MPRKVSTVLGLPLYEALLVAQHSGTAISRALWYSNSSCTKEEVVQVM